MKKGHQVGSFSSINPISYQLLKSSSSATVTREHQHTRGTWRYCGSTISEGKEEIKQLVSVRLLVVSILITEYRVNNKCLWGGGKHKTRRKEIPSRANNNLSRGCSCIRRKHRNFSSPRSFSYQRDNADSKLVLCQGKQLPMSNELNDTPWYQQWAHHFYLFIFFFYK